jgi:hypothetical protein
MANAATPLTGVPVRPIVATRVGLLAAQLGSRLLPFLIIRAPVRSAATPALSVVAPDPTPGTEEIS